MFSTRIYLVTSVLLLCVSLYHLVRHDDLIRRLLALNVMTSAIFLFLVALAHGDGSAAPDPVPHAMVLTGIVVAVSTTALALALIRRLHQQTGRTELTFAAGDEDGE